MSVHVLSTDFSRTESVRVVPGNRPVVDIVLAATVVARLQRASNGAVSHATFSYVLKNGEWLFTHGNYHLDGGGGPISGGLLDDFAKPQENPWEGQVPMLTFADRGETETKLTYLRDRTQWAFHAGSASVEPMQSIVDSHRPISI